MLLPPDWFIGRATSGHHDDFGDSRKAPARKLVLIVGADAPTRGWYRNQLQQIGHEVDETGDVSAAISFLERRREAVVFAHLATFSEAEGARLRDYLARHREFPLVATMTLHPDPPSTDEQDTERILVPDLGPGSRRT